MVLAHNGEEGDDQRNEERPDEAGHSMEKVPKELHAEAGRVVDDDVVADHAKDEEDERGLGPAERVECLAQHASEPVALNLIRVVVGCVFDAEGGVAEAGADDGDEGGGDGDTPDGEHEDLPARCVGRIVAVVVCSDGAPAGGARKADSHEREPRACESETCVKSGNRGIDIRCCLADQDAEKDDGQNPGIFLVGVDQGKSEDRDEVADHDDDDAADGDGHGV